MYKDHRLSEAGSASQSFSLNLSRRHFLTLFLAVGVAGCGTAQKTTLAPQLTGTPPAKTPSPRHPSASIEPENAHRVVSLAVLEVNAGEVKSVAWSPDSRLLALGAYRSLQIWDSVTGKQVAAMSRHSGQIWWVSWSPDGSLLASAAEDGTMLLWDARQRTLKHVLQSQSQIVLSVTWSPDGRHVLAGTIDGTLEMWDVRSGTRLATWRGHSPQDVGKTGPWSLAVFAACWSPDGRRIASAREDNIVQLWDAGTGTVLSVWQTNMGSANVVAWSPDGQTVAVTNDLGSVQLWSVRTGKTVAVLDAHAKAGWASMVIWSPNGRMLASTREDGTLQLWDAGTKKELTALQGHSSEVWGAAWSPDGLRLASGSKDETVRIWGVP